MTSTTYAQAVDYLDAVIKSRLYEIRVQQRYSQTVNQVKHFGRLSSGNRRVDADLDNSIVTRYIRIIDMLKYYQESMPFHIAKPTDQLHVYETVTGYFDAMIAYFERELNCTPVDIDYITRLDQIAMELHTVLHTENRSTMIEATAPPSAVSFMLTPARADPNQYKAPRWHSRIPKLSELLSRRGMI